MYGVIEAFVFVLHDKMIEGKPIITETSYITN